MRSRKGFTIVEILIALGVFGLVLALLAVLLNANQKELRDTKRISDMQALRGAMSVVKNEKGGFDQTYCELTVVSACSQKAPSELNKVLSALARFNDPKAAGVACQNKAACVAGCNYAFTRLEANDYEVLFYLEKGVNEFSSAGCYKLTAAGISKL